MISIKGFGINTNLSNNVKDIVNPIGELSAWSMTYSKDRGVYYQNDTDAIVLMTFSVKDDGVDKVLTVNQRSHILSVLKWLYKANIDKGAEVYAHEMLQSLTEQFASSATKFTCGEMVSDPSGRWMPEWLAWEVKNQSETTKVRIWFSDDSFKRSYDEHEIVVVPPIENLDDFFKVSQKVKPVVDAVTRTKQMENVQVAKQSKPETVIRTELFNYVDPLDKTNKIPTLWDVLIYGENGNNIDSIKEAIIKHIMANTRKTRAEWAELFPDIFKRTEFTIVPQWNRYAIPNRITEAGIHSPFVDVKGISTFMSPFVRQYNGTHVTNHTQVFTHPYKSLMLISCSSNENRDNLFKLTDVFPDYIAQSSTFQDFNRQNEPTRDWSEILTEMILTAEEMTQYTDIPKGYTRLVRDGKLYIVKNIDNIHYLVAAKENFPAQ